MGQLFCPARRQRRKQLDNRAIGRTHRHDLHRTIGRQIDSGRSAPDRAPGRLDPGPRPGEIRHRVAHRQDTELRRLGPLGQITPVQTGKLHQFQATGLARPGLKNAGAARDFSGQIVRQAEIVGPGRRVQKITGPEVLQAQHRGEEGIGALDVGHHLHGIEGLAEALELPEFVQWRRKPLVEGQIDAIGAFEHHIGQYRGREIEAHRLAFGHPAQLKGLIIERSQPLDPQHQAEITPGVPGPRTHPDRHLPHAIEPDKSQETMIRARRPQKQKLSPGRCLELPVGELARIHRPTRQHLVSAQLHEQSRAVVEVANTDQGFAPGRREQGIRGLGPSLSQTHEDAQQRQHRQERTIVWTHGVSDPVPWRLTCHCHTTIDLPERKV